MGLLICLVDMSKKHLILDKYRSLIDEVASDIEEHTLNHRNNINIRIAIM